MRPNRPLLRPQRHRPAKPRSTASITRRVQPQRPPHRPLRRPLPPPPRSNGRAVRNYEPRPTRGSYVISWELFELLVSHFVAPRDSAAGDVVLNTALVRR